MGQTLSLFFPPAPALTEDNLPPQKGKVFVVTGGYSGVGYELCAILYRAGGTVYLAGRSQEKADAAISQIEALPADAPGKLVFLHVALDDLTTVKAAAERFKAQESRLDVLFNNAGVSNPPAEWRSAQGHDLQMATNCLGPYLLTQLLVPTLVATAKTEAPAAVRVVFTASMMMDLTAPVKQDITQFSNPGNDVQANYITSKTGNWYLASELAAQVGPQGVLSVVQNPGNMKTPLLRHLPWIVGFISSPLLYTAKFGAYTELWSGLSPDLVIEDGGKYIQSWGRLHQAPRADLVANLKSKEEGGTGLAAEFAEYCERTTAEFR